MFRNIGFGAVAALAVGALAIGCSDDGDTIVGGNAAFVDLYPGSQVFENNVADDGRAFTNQGQNIFNDQLEMYWNVTDGHAIAMYQLESTIAPAGSDTRILYAVYFNGTAWAAPVQIRGRDVDEGVFEDPDNAANGYKVLWLNTAGSTIPEAAARNGDAIILIRRDDLGPPPQQTTNEDENSRLWMTYFDRSAATSPASGTVVRGFNTDAIVVDDEVIFTGVGDPDVGTFGFVSDSHEGTHEYTAFVDEVDSGQPTTFASIVYAKQESTTEGVRYLTKAILGDAVDNDLASLLGAETQVPAGAALVTSETVTNSVDNNFYTHNELMVWNAQKDPGFDQDVILTATTFDEDGPVDSELVGNTFESLNDQSDLTELQAFYGPDQGLAAFYLLFTETGFNPDNNPGTGERDDDSDLFVAQINADEALAVQTEALEVFADTLTFTVPSRTGANTGVSNVESRLNRSADFITVLFQETSTDVVEASAGNFNNVNDLLYVAAIQTRRASTFGDTDVRDLADSVVAPVQVPSIVASGTNLGSGAEADVGGVEFQQDLVESDSLPNCAIQSDANRVNFIYTQRQDSQTVISTSSDLENLLVNGIEFIPGVLVDDSPDFDLVDSAQEIIATRDADYGVGFDAVALDAGDQTRDATGAPDGESGRVLVFYVLNANNPTSDPSETASAFDETRLFVYDQGDGDSELVSTDGPREFDQVTNGALIGWATVPVNEDFVNTPHHAGTTLHVFWSEAVNDGPAQRIMTRSYDKGAINDGATTNDTLATRFTPNLPSVATGAAAVQLDSLTDGPLFEVEEDGSSDFFTVARSGSTVAVHFAEDEHVYYSDTTGDATLWDYDNGSPAPQLVDNDSLTGNRVIAWRVQTPPECNDLPKSMVIFVRDEASQFNTNALDDAIRAYIRIHN